MTRFDTLILGATALTCDAADRVIEDAAIGMAIHGKTFAQSTADLGGGTLRQMIATEFIVFLVFIPLFAFGALSEVMEDKALVRTFFVERLKFEVVR